MQDFWIYSTCQAGCEVDGTNNVVVNSSSAIVGDENAPKEGGLDRRPAIDFQPAG